VNDSNVSRRRDARRARLTGRRLRIGRFIEQHEALASTTTPPVAFGAPGSPNAAVTPYPGDAITHVFVIVLENESGAAAIRDSYLAQLAARGARLTSYHAVAHPSQPNYVAMLAGDTLVSDDGNHDLGQSNLVDLLESAHHSWKAYLEGYPGKCFAGGSASSKQGGNYARKHNPFISFNDIRTNPARCANIVDASQLDSDIANGQFPEFSFYTPNLDNDGHDTSLAFASKWLKGFIEPKLADPKFNSGTLVVVTFDEGTGNPADDALYTVLLGPMVVPGSSDATSYSHYSLLRTVESVFGLGSLGRSDAAAAPFASCNFGSGCGP
jgi:Phosphoesterase family